MEESTFSFDEGKVSVIIPCYQHGHFLPQAIESVLKQTYQLTEIIIVNDGSTDNTHEIGTSYAQKYPGRIKYIQQQQQGQVKARKRATSLARGEFWLTLDADDLLEDQMLEQCVQVLLDNPDAAVVASDVWIVAPDGKTIIDKLEQNKLPSWPDILSHNPLGGIAGILLRAEAVQKVGGLGFVGAENYPGAEDWDLWIRLVKARMKFLHIPRCLARYRQTSSSHSRKALDVLRGILLVLEYLKSEDPRLGQVLEPYPPINTSLYNLLRNRAVFLTYGIACAAGEAEETLKKILDYFVPSVIDVQLFSQSFLGGINRQILPTGKDCLARDIYAQSFQLLENYLKPKVSVNTYDLLISTIEAQIALRQKRDSQWYRMLKKRFSNLLNTLRLQFLT